MRAYFFTSRGGPRNELIALGGSEGPKGPPWGPEIEHQKIVKFQEKKWCPKNTLKRFLDPPEGGPWRGPKKFGRGQKIQKGAKEA